jgi:hypothetical protein
VERRYRLAVEHYKTAAGALAAVARAALRSKTAMGRPSVPLALSREVTKNMLLGWSPMPVPALPAAQNEQLSEGFS